MEFCSCQIGSYGVELTTTLLLAAALAGPGTPSSPAPEQTRIVMLRVYDNAHTSAADRREAENVSARIVRPLGVQLAWKECAPPGRHTPDPCAEIPGSQELVVRLLPGAESGPAVLGTANVPGVVATLLVDRIRATARRNRKPMALLLGAVMAHEVIHLLLGSRGHVAQGLMRATWTDADIRLGWIWTIGRSDDERRAIGAAIRGTVTAPPIAVAQDAVPDGAAKAR